MRMNMRDVFESQLKTLKDDMIEMGSMIEKAIENAIRALNNRDTELARAAIEADSEIDEQEKKIESLPETFIASAAGSKRSSHGVFCIKDGHGYGAYRRSCGRYFRNNDLPC